MRVTSEEFRDDYDMLSELATREPLVITSEGADRLVLISAREWDRLKHGDRRCGLAGDLSGEWLQAIAKAEVASALDGLDDDLRDP